MVDFTRMWRELRQDISNEIIERLRQAGIVGTTINGAHMPGKTLPTHAHAHADTTGQTADDHHDKSHAHDGADDSGTVAHSDTTGQTANDHHAEDHHARHEVGGADELTLASLSSGAATVGQVLAADGAGGIAWQDQAVRDWSVLTNGDPVTPELVFADGDVIMVASV